MLDALGQHYKFVTGVKKLEWATGNKKIIPVFDKTFKTPKNKTIVFSFCTQHAQKSP
jgi:hypothetical protein